MTNDKLTQEEKLKLLEAIKNDFWFSDKKYSKLNKDNKVYYSLLINEGGMTKEEIFKLEK